MTSLLLAFFIKIISSLGYTGIFLLMVTESMILPTPSEAVMPFAGFLFFQGQMSFWLIIIFATLGSIIGSLISYAIGLYAGRPLVEKYGKYILLTSHHLKQTENFFAKFGDKAVFICRFVPVVRHFISLPAGFAKMKLGKFCLYTILGAGLWNAFLTYVGYLLGSGWQEIKQYSEKLDLIVIFLIILIIWWFYKNKGKITLNKTNHS